MHKTVLLEEAIDNLNIKEITKSIEELKIEYMSMLLWDSGDIVV